MTAKAKKRRIDVLLVDRGLADSRARAQALVMAGAVFASGQRVDKPGRELPDDAEIDVRGKDHPWVSRGGLKLAHALEAFGYDPAGQVAIDVGASTGGFTDVLLQKGASRIYAVDVGHGQLDWKLRSDDRVVVLERTNARHLTEAEIPETVGLVVCDASFIGLAVVLPAALERVGPGGTCIALIKPQFEAGREEVGKKGVVRDPAVHEAVCERVRDWFDSLPGWRMVALDESPVLGPEGNKEFLIFARKDSNGEA